MVIQPNPIALEGKSSCPDVPFGALELARAIAPADICDEVA
jgi:hypothetical protein